MGPLIALFGLAVFVATAVLFSSHPKKIAWKTVLSGLALQFVLGLLIIKFPLGRELFSRLNDGALVILGATNEGSRFLFGSLVDQEKSGFIFALSVLPTIVFMSSLMALLYHWGVMQKLISAMSRVVEKVMGTSATESLAACANVFAGQTEAPLIVRPYLDKMTQSELMALMTGGMATMAGAVLAAYAGMGIDAGHLLAASVMSAPAALVCAKILKPEVEESLTKGKVRLVFEKESVNSIDAICSGAAEGLKLALNIGAMLLCFIAMIALFNMLLASIGGYFGFEDLSFELISAYLFYPISLLLSVSPDESFEVAKLLGKKLFLNEFVAYVDLIAVKDQLSERSTIIATYALCGFANFSSIAIQIGGLGTLIPGRRKDVIGLGLLSLLGGSLACFMTACIAGLFI